MKKAIGGVVVGLAVIFVISAPDEAANTVRWVATGIDGVIDFFRSLAS